MPQEEAGDTFVSMGHRERQSLGKKEVGKHCKCHVLPYYWKPLAFWPSCVSSCGRVKVRFRK